MTDRDIYDAMDRGERLTPEQIAFAKRHRLCLWGSVNEIEARTAYEATPESIAHRTAKPLPLLTDQELNRLQTLSRKYR